MGSRDSRMSPRGRGGPLPASLLKRSHASLTLVPISLACANQFVRELHRHAPPTVGHKFSIGCEAYGKLVGVSIIGRTIARMSDDGKTAEVLRLCTDGTKNANSFLYAASARACRAMGYSRIQTYILDSEPGISLRAAGWHWVAASPGGQWNDYRPDARQLRLDGTVRRIREGENAGSKQRWQKEL